MKMSSDSDGPIGPPIELPTRIHNEGLPLDDPRIRTTPAPMVLVVDDEAAVRTTLAHLLTRAGYVVEVAVDGPSALAAIAALAPDVVLLDLVLPGGMTGFEVCRRLKHDVATRLMPVIVITGLDATSERVEALDAGADDFLTKPFDTSELLARVRSLTRIKQYTDDLDSASAILTALATMIEARDGYGAGHCHRMANFAARVGRTLQIPDADIRTLYRGAFLHDIGMLAISDSVLRKQGPLTDDEYEHVKAHTVLGDALCVNLRSLRPIRPIIRWHHERIDGSGYPDGLQGDQIPLLAQIVGVVDVYEAVTTKRPYQPLHSPDDAVAVLRRGVAAGTFAGNIVDAFVATLEARHVDKSASPHASKPDTPRDDEKASQ